MKPELSIIGYGRFGKFAADHLSPYFSIRIAGHKLPRRLPRSFQRVSIIQAAHSPFVILAVPINQLQSVLRQIAPHVPPGTLVCDVASVKEQPIRWMKKILPHHCSILGTHPLFGPDSVADSFTGRSIVLCPERIQRNHLGAVRQGLQSVGLTVHVMSPRSHDRQMASTLLLSQFIGRGIHDANLPPTILSTRNSEMLMEIVRTTMNDTEELFRDMYVYNRSARPVLKQLVHSFQSVLPSTRSKSNRERHGLREKKMKR